MNDRTRRPIPIHPDADDERGLDTTLARPGDRLLRLPQVLAPYGPIPVSRTQWWEGVRSGRFPSPLRLGPRTVAWRKRDIDALVESGARMTSEPVR